MKRTEPKVRRLSPPQARREMVQQALLKWNIRNSELRLIRHVENTLFKVVTSREQFVARLSRHEVKTPVAVRGEVRFIERCATRGIHVVEPVGTKDGDVIATTPNLDRSVGEVPDRIVTLFRMLPGRRISRRNLNERFAYHWGATIARMHLATEKFRQTKAAHRPEWFDVDFQGDPLKSPMRELSWFRRDWKHCEAWLQNLPKDDYGLIHADLHHKNFRFLDGEILIFDFDDSFVGWRAYDLAVVWPELGRSNDEGRNRAMRSALLDGYRLVRELSEEWEARIPALYRVRRLWLASWGAMRQDVPRIRRWHEGYVPMLEMRMKTKLEQFV